MEKIRQNELASIILSYSKNNKSLFTFYKYYNWVEACASLLGHSIKVSLQCFCDLTNIDNYAEIPTPENRILGYPGCMYPEKCLKYSFKMSFPAFCDFE